LFKKEKFIPNMVNKSKVRRRRAALAKAADQDVDETLETEDETLETEDEENSSGSDSSNGDVGLETITEEAFEEDNTADKDSLLKNTASAGTDDPTRVQSTIPDVLMEEDETIKVEGVSDGDVQVDPVDEFHYLLDMFSDENVDILNTIIDRRRDRNVRTKILCSNIQKCTP
jgi:hypothetical protein